MNVGYFSLNSQNSYAVAVDEFQGLYVIKITNAKDMQVVSTVKVQGKAKDLVIFQPSSNYTIAYLIDESSLYQIDLSNPASPQQLDQIILAGDANSISFFNKSQQNFLLLTMRQKKFEIYKINDDLTKSVTKISEKGQLSYYLNGAHIYSQGQSIYALILGNENLKGSVSIYDLTQTNSPSEKSYLSDTSMAISYRASTFSNSDNQIFVFLANNYLGWKIIEVTNPANPTPISSFTSIGLGLGIRIWQDLENNQVYAIASNGGGGLTIYDLYYFKEDPSQISNLREIAQVPLQGTAYMAIKVSINSQNSLLVASGSSGVGLISVAPSNQISVYPSSLKLILDKEITGGGSRVKSFQQANRDYALIADGGNGLSIYDVTIPNNPQKMSSLPVSGGQLGAYKLKVLKNGQSQYAFVSLFLNAGIDVFDITNIQNPSKIVNIQLQFVYDLDFFQKNMKQFAIVVAGSGEKIFIFDVTSIQNPQKIQNSGTYGSSNPNSVSVFIKNEKAYVAIADYEGNFYIANITDEKNTQALSNLSLSSGLFESIQTFSTGNQEFFAIISATNEGIYLIKISDVMHPEFLSNINPGGITSISETVILQQNENTFAIASGLGGGIIVFDLSNPSNIHIILQKSIPSKSADGVSAYISNGRPMLMAITTKVFNPARLIMLQISKDYELQPRITSQNTNKVKKFFVNMHIIDTQTMNSNINLMKLLNLKVGGGKDQEGQPLPYWVSQNLQQSILYFVPPDTSQLNLLEAALYTFSAQFFNSDFDSVSPGKSPDQVIAELINKNYLSSNLYIAQDFDTDRALILDPGFDSTTILEALKKKLYKGGFQLKLEDFLAVNSAPYLYRNLQSQFLQQIQKAKVGKSLDLQLLADSFLDDDDDALVYSIKKVQVKFDKRNDSQSAWNSSSELPSWLSFSAESRRFIGTPTIEELDKEYQIQIQVSDGYAEATSSFNFSLYDAPPKLNMNKSNNTLQSQFNLRQEKVKVTKLFDFTFAFDTFIDGDNEELTYSASQVPHWLSFNAQQRRFIGTPLIGEDGKGFEIVVTATDGIKSEQDSFIFSLNNAPPISVGNLEEHTIDLGQAIDFVLLPSQFYDPDGDELAYSAEYWNQGNKENNLPIWMSFDKEKRRIFGIPQAKNILYDENKARYYQEFSIKIIATDIAEAKAWQNLNVVVVHDAPKINQNFSNLQSQLADSLSSGETQIKVNKKLSFAFSSSSFIFSKNWVPSYKATIWDKSQNAYHQVNTATEFWLKFDNQNLKFFGIPSKNDLGEYQVTVEASDGLKSAHQNFSFELSNSPPYAFKDLQNQLPKSLVNEEFVFQFSSESFRDDDGDLLSYQAFDDNGSSKLGWLEFDAESRTFKGTPAESDVLQDINIKVVASDSISSIVATQSFQLETHLSFIYVFEKLIAIMGPILGAIGILAYRMQLYALFCRKKYQYKRKEIAIVGAPYCKKIRIGLNQVSQAGQIWKEMKKNDKQKRLEDYCCQDQEKIKQEIHKAVQKQKKSGKIASDDEKSLPVWIFADSAAADMIISVEKYNKEKKIYQEIKKKLSEKSSKDWYKDVLDINAFEFTIKEQKYNEIKNAISNLAKPHNSKALNIDDLVIQNAIIAEARGNTQLNQGILSPSKGETIQIEKLDLLSIIAYRKRKGINFMDKLLKKLSIFKLDYQQIELSGNNTLPTWMSADLVDDFLIISGTPQPQHIGELMIQILDSQQFIAREFFMSIETSNQLMNSQGSIQNESSQLLNSSSISIPESDSQGKKFEGIELQQMEKGFREPNE